MDRFTQYIFIYLFTHSKVHDWLYSWNIGQPTNPSINLNKHCIVLLVMAVCWSLTLWLSEMMWVGLKSWIVSCLIVANQIALSIRSGDIGPFNVGWFCLVSLFLSSFFLLGLTFDCYLWFLFCLNHSFFVYPHHSKLGRNLNHGTVYCLC